MKYPKDHTADQESILQKSGLLKMISPGQLAKELKTSAEWEEELPADGWEVMDPDGWDRSNFQYSFYEEKITKEEYQRRRTKSTCIKI